MLAGKFGESKISSPNLPMFSIANVSRYSNNTVYGVASLLV